MLRHFEDALDAAVDTFFIPLLIGTGGNAGSQTTSTIIRALAVGEVTTRDARCDPNRLGSARYRPAPGIDRLHNVAGLVGILFGRTYHEK